MIASSISNSIYCWATADDVESPLTDSAVDWVLLLAKSIIKEAPEHL